MNKPYGVWEITNVPKYLDSLIKGPKTPSWKELKSLIEWQKKHKIKGGTK